MPKAQRLKPPRDRDPDAFVEPWSVKWLQRSLCLMAEERAVAFGCENCIDFALFCEHVGPRS